MSDAVTIADVEKRVLDAAREDSPCGLRPEHVAAIGDEWRRIAAADPPIPERDAPPLLRALDAPKLNRVLAAYRERLPFHLSPRDVARLAARMGR